MEVKVLNVDVRKRNNMKQKRYQHWTSSGIQWTKWFDISENTPEEPIQNKCANGVKLKNEYRTV